MCVCIIMYGVFVKTVFVYMHACAHLGVYVHACMHACSMWHVYVSVRVCVCDARVMRVCV